MQQLFKLQVWQIDTLKSLAIHWIFSCFHLFADLIITSNPRRRETMNSRPQRSILDYSGRADVLWSEVKWSPREELINTRWLCKWKPRAQIWEPQLNTRPQPWSTTKCSNIISNLRGRSSTFNCAMNRSKCDPRAPCSRLTTTTATTTENRSVLDSPRVY